MGGFIFISISEFGRFGKMIDKKLTNDILVVIWFSLLAARLLLHWFLKFWMHLESQSNCGEMPIAWIKNKSMPLNNILLISRKVMPQIMTLGQSRPPVLGLRCITEIYYRWSPMSEIHLKKTSVPMTGLA